MRVLTNESALVLDHLVELAGSSQNLENALRQAKQRSPEGQVQLDALVEILASFPGEEQPPEIERQLVSSR